MGCGCGWILFFVFQVSGSGRITNEMVILWHNCPEGFYSKFSPDCFCFSAHQPQSLHLPGVVFPCWHQIDSCGFNAAVSQYIRKLYDISAYLVKGSCEEMAEIVGEYFGWIYAGFLTQLFHFPPDLASGHPCPLTGDKNFPCCNLLLSGIVPKFLTELPGKEDCPDFSFQGNICPSPGKCLHRDIPHLRHPDAGGTDCLQQKSQPEIPVLPCAGPS